MEWRHFTRAQYITTAWSGGTTTQLAIAPEGDLTLSDAGVQAAAGELLLCERADASFLHLESKAGTAIMAAVIYTR